MKKHSKERIVLTLICISLLSIVLGSASADVYLGVVEGYVMHVNNTTVENATVTVTLPDCSGGGCSGNTTTDSNGYYTVGNLDTSANEEVKVYAEKGKYYGKETGYTDSSGLAYINVTIARPPEEPNQTTKVDDPHNQTVGLYCEPGKDPNGLPTVVQVSIDGGAITENETYDKFKNFSFGSHSWKCRTCNTYLCSGWVYDSFTLVNDPPSKPDIVNQSNTKETTVSLEWDSGSDPDGDKTIDYYEFEGNLTKDAESPMTESGLEKFEEYQWRVKTCDEYGACSNWVTDKFVTYKEEVRTVSGGGGGGGGIIYRDKPSYTILASLPSLVKVNQTFRLEVLIDSNSNLENTSIQLNKSEAIETITIDEEEGNNQKNVTFSMRSMNSDPSEQNLTLIINLNETKNITKNLKVKVREKEEPGDPFNIIGIIPQREIKPRETGKETPNNLIILLVIITFFTLMTTHLLRERYKFN